MSAVLSLFFLEVSAQISTVLNPTYTSVASLLDKAVQLEEEPEPISTSGVLHRLQENPIGIFPISGDVNNKVEVKYKPATEGNHGADNKRRPFFYATRYIIDPNPCEAASGTEEAKQGGIIEPEYLELEDDIFVRRFAAGFQDNNNRQKYYYGQWWTPCGLPFRGGRSAQIKYNKEEHKTNVDDCWTPYHPSDQYSMAVCKEWGEWKYLGVAKLNKGSLICIGHPAPVECTTDSAGYLMSGDRDNLQIYLPNAESSINGNFEYRTLDNSRTKDEVQVARSEESIRGIYGFVNPEEPIL